MDHTTQNDSRATAARPVAALAAPIGAGDTVVLKSDVLAILGRSEPALRRDRRAGLAPAFFLVGRRRVGLLRSEVDVLVAAKAAGLSDDAVRGLVAGMIEHRARLAAALGAESAECSK